MSNYSSFNFYEPKVFGRNEYFKLFSEDLNPLFHYLDILETDCGYFFVRYKDEYGPHIRIRIKGLNDVHQKVILGLDERIKVSEYVPEYDRYGGKELISFSEALFEETSLLIKELFSENPEWTYENSILFSIVLNFLIIQTNNIDHVEGILESNIDFWTAQTLQNNEEDSWKRLAKAYQENKAAFKKGFSFVRGELEQRMKGSNNFLFYKNLDTISVKQRNVVVEGIIHMTNNRFGIYNIDEPLINYYLLMCLKDE